MRRFLKNTKWHGPTFGAVVLFTLIGVVVVLLFARQVEYGRQGAKAHAALCELKAQYESQVHKTKAFLKTHPQKVILTLPRQYFITGDKQLEKRIMALNKDLGACPK